MEKSNYHHGDLKQKILNIAIVKIEETGAENLSIREIARELDISKNAPYRHYKNKLELLGAIGNFGFKKLTEMMNSVVSSNNTSKDNMLNMGDKYIEFCRKYPEIYNTMFKMDFSALEYNPEYEENGKASFMVLLNEVQRGMNSGEFKKADPLKISISIWAYIHGCSSFYIENIHTPFNNVKDDIFERELLLNGLLN